MRSGIKIRRSLMVISIIVSCIFLATKCTNDSDHPADSGYTTKADRRDNFKDYAGSAVCASCHKTVYDTHIHTKHFLTSTPAAEKTILGSFVKGKNDFVFDKFTTMV